MKRLLRNHRNHVRTVARMAYISAGGDKDKAIDLGKQNLRADPGSVIGAILIQLAISLLVKIIMHWIFNGVSSPAAEYAADEPGFEEFTESDAEGMGSDE